TEHAADDADDHRGQAALTRGAGGPAGQSTSDEADDDPPQDTHAADPTSGSGGGWVSVAGGVLEGGTAGLTKLLTCELDAPQADLLRALVEPPIVVGGLDQHQLSFHGHSLPGGCDSQSVRRAETSVTPSVASASEPD